MRFRKTGAGPGGPPKGPNGQKSFKNTMRNIALVVLTLLMGGMTLLSGITAVGSEAVMRSFRRSLGHASLGYEVRSGESPAAYPSSAAMTGADGQLYGAAYQERSVMQLYEATRELMGSALASAEQFSTLSESGLRALLKGETLCYAYNGEIPAAALAAWMEAQSSGTLHVSMLLLTRDGRLALRTKEQGLVAASAAVDSGAWQRAAQALGAGACTYAGLREEPVYRRLAAETLLFDDAPASAYTLTSAPPAFGDPNAADSLQTLLEAFGYSVYARSYQERDTQVYVDNDSTIRISADGMVRYAAARREEEVLLSLTDAVEQARGILERAQYSISAGTQAELLSATGQENSIILFFGQVFEGIPIVTDEPYARFEFADGQLLRASIRLKRYAADGGRQYILPAAQAAAAAPRTGMRLGIAYMEKEDGTFVPERCFTFADAE